MSDHAKVLAIADEVVSKAEGALAAIERELIVMKWPPEFCAIMWDAIADIASRRALKARSEMEKAG